ncbi:hypothetical protein V8C42DRAFT_325752 [Trichoderma barbatum]
MRYLLHTLTVFAFLSTFTCTPSILYSSHEQEMALDQQCHPHTPPLLLSDRDRLNGPQAAVKQKCHFLGLLHKYEYKRLRATYLGA